MVSDAGDMRVPGKSGQVIGGILVCGSRPATGTDPNSWVLPIADQARCSLTPAPSMVGFGFKNLLTARSDMVTSWGLLYSMREGDIRCNK